MKFTVEHIVSKILIGTSSWTDPGFVQDWYPRRLAASQRLRWYAEHFSLVEVNSTFYAIPPQRMVARWCEETPSNFVFDVKLPKVLSRHSMSAKFLPPDLRTRVPVTKRGIVQFTNESEELIVRRFLRELEPLVETGKLGAFLLQLSPSFRPKTHQLTELDSLGKLLNQFPLAVELRNRDWVTGAQFQETVEYFTERRLTLVLVDAPTSEHFTVMPGFDHVTNPRLGYLRLHGRNAEGYIKGRTVAERFDYDYSDVELRELAERARKLEAEVERLHILANNNRSNFAPKAAAKLQELLGLKRRLERHEQGTLF